MRPLESDPDYLSFPWQTVFDLCGISMPILRLFDPETAHSLGIWFARNGLVPRDTRADSSLLKTTVWGKSFSNPIGLAAGFDKHAQVMEAMLGIGFGFVEVGKC